MHPYSEIDSDASEKVEMLVPWMSGLVSGLQNRVRRFESARNLRKLFRTEVLKSFLFLYSPLLVPSSDIRMKNAVLTLSETKIPINSYVIYHKKVVSLHQEF